MIITIDGPTASGKSSVARLLAKELNCYYLYTGLLYRAVAYVLVKMYGYTLDQLEFVAEDTLALVFSGERLAYRYTIVDGAQVFFDGVDITPQLKVAAVDVWTSYISSQKNVREAITRLQSEIAGHTTIVVEGRDCGSVVFPSAEYKIFITASLVVRAERWAKDQMRLGVVFLQESAESAVKDRDQRDEQRMHSPLIVPKGAFIIDNSQLTLQETVQRILSFIAP